MSFALVIEQIFYYNKCMDNQLLIPNSGQISLLIAPSVTIAILMEMTAQMAMQTRLLVLDGGNRFDGYGLARALRKRTADLDAALQNVLLSRVFTCYQMKALLSEMDHNSMPLLVLDILATFLDENVKLPARQDLLADCLVDLQRLSQSAPVILWVRKRSLPGIEDEGLLDQVLAASQKTWQFENPGPVARQMTLFELPGQQKY
jgi:hypothetical protein